MYLAEFSSRALSRSDPIISSAFFQVSQKRRNPLWETHVHSLRTFLSCCISSSRTSPWKHQVIQDVPAALIQGNDIEGNVAFWPERESPFCWFSGGITGFLTVCNTCSESPCDGWLSVSITVHHWLTLVHSHNKLWPAHPDISTLPPKCLWIFHVTHKLTNSKREREKNRLMRKNSRKGQEKSEKRRI